MTVSTSASRVSYAGNGVTVSFSVPFPFIQEDYLLVVLLNTTTLVETTLVLNSIGPDGYTVTGAGAAAGSVLLVTPPASGEVLSIIRDVPATQESDFVANDPFPAETFEDSLDKVTMVAAQASNDAERSLKLFDGDIDGTGRYNGNGNRITNIAEGINSTDAATVSQIIGGASGDFVQGGTGAIIRTMQTKVRETVSVADFGDLAAADVGPIFQLAANYAATNGIRRVLVPDLQYTMTTPVVYEAAVEFYSAGLTDLTTATAGGGHATTRPSIRWDGAADATMFRQMPPASGTIVIGGGMRGIHLDGNTLAGIGLLLDNCRFSRVALHGRGFRECLLKLNSASGTAGVQSQKVFIDEIRYTFGLSSQPDTLNGCGVIIEGDGSTITQVQADLIDGQVYDGDLLRITEHDNGLFKYVRGSVFTGRNGHALKITNTSGTGVQDGCQNVFYHLVGPVDLGANTFNTKIFNFNTEAGYIEGAGLWHGEVMDYITAEMFKTHAYRMLDRISFPLNNFFAVSGTPAVALSSSTAPAWAFDPGAIERIAALLPAPFDWSKGQITGVRLFLTMAGAESGADVVVRVRSGSPGEGGNITAISGDETRTVAVNDTAGIVVVEDITFATPIAYSKNDMAYLSVYRNGTDVADTATTDMHLLGAQLVFESLGPNRVTTPDPLFTPPAPALPAYL